MKNERVEKIDINDVNLMTMFKCPHCRNGEIYTHDHLAPKICLNCNGSGFVCIKNYDPTHVLKL